MNAIVNHLFAVFIRLGPFGLLILGFLDSSFLLFLPLGNDLLMVALTARKHGMLPVFVVMATAGSVLGCALTDWVARKGGEKGLEKIIAGRRLNYVTRKVKESAGKALVFACLMPPPFPFTAFVAGAAAFQYPRKKLLATIALARLARFSILGMLAIAFGVRILRLAKTPGVQMAILALAVISVVGSIVSVVSWIKRSREAGA
jgi:membrane protein YqaA with SNARE-associated domain